MVPRSSAQTTYIEGLKALILAHDARRQAEEFMHNATKQLRNSGVNPNDAPLLRDLMEEAIAASGLDDDSPAVRKFRDTFDAAVMIREAIDNGMDPEEAEFIVMLGGDPRKTDPFSTGPEVGFNGFQF